MGEIFLKVLNMSIAASWLILAVALLRFLLKKAPKWIVILLWGIVAIKLVCPFTVESPVSMIPDSVGSGELISEWMNDYIGNVDIYHPDSVHYDAAIGAGRKPISNGEGGYYIVTKHDQLGEPDTIENTVVPVLSVMWVAGITVWVFYAVVSFFRLRHRVNEAVIFKENILLCDHVRTPFILGLVRPNIYLPSSMDAAAMEPVIAHEKAHLARRDHWWKPLGFLILSVHWFNPLCWVAYVLLCRDIELACDEKVIRQMDLDGKKQYSTALLECSTGRRLVTICPLAFGEVGVKERVKNVLTYRKPAFWIIVAAVIVCIVMAVCFLTDPVSHQSRLEPFSPDSISQNVYNDLQHEWDSWNLLSQESKMFSSHVPGLCRRDFDNWAECEAFPGFSIPNPLGECTWLEQATYVAMPVGFRGAPRIEAGWYGTEEGHIERISVQGGYRNGEIRVMIGAMLYGDPAGTKPSDRGWVNDLERQAYLENADDAPLQVSTETTDRYFSCTAYQAYGAILYRFHVVGNPDAQSQVESTLDQVITAFSEEFSQNTKRA